MWILSPVSKASLCYRAPRESATRGFAQPTIRGGASRGGLCRPANHSAMIIASNSPTAGSMLIALQAIEPWMMTSPTAGGWCRSISKRLSGSSGFSTRTSYRMPGTLAARKPSTRGRSGPLPPVRRRGVQLATKASRSRSQGQPRPLPRTCARYREGPSPLGTSPRTAGRAVACADARTMPADRHPGRRRECASRRARGDRFLASTRAQRADTHPRRTDRDGRDPGDLVAVPCSPDARGRGSERLRACSRHPRADR